MITLKDLISNSLFVLFLFSTALAQEDRGPIETLREPVAVAALPAAPLVTATATAERVRFVSPGTVVQLRLEVYNETGQKLFDTELHGGNVLDWHLQDGAGQRLASGSYACVLTTKSLSGRLSQRVGRVTVNDKKAAVEAAGTTQLSQLSMAQQQIIGPVEGNAAFTVLQEHDAEALTAVTHDGADGQMTRTRGALSFRVGDFFSGKDKEQMRLTEDGNLGIGTDKPQVKLDVAGMIRAREGLMFSDGSTLKVNEKGVLTRTSADGATPNSITSTQNRIAKFTDNAGTLGDSNVTEATGKLGIGTPSPNYEITLFGNDVGLQLISPGTGTTANDGFRFGLSSTNSAFLWNTEATDMYFGTTATERMRIKATGNVGIGTNNPTAKLDVVGVINASTHYNIGGLRVLSISGTGSEPNSNVFAGVGAGAANTGTNNSFFGSSAGAANTLGVFNSFFGKNAGAANTMANANSFFGNNAGAANSGAFNSFFGASAGLSNTAGAENSFFGMNTGISNTTGNDNSFFGTEAGLANTAGFNNSFFGSEAGYSNTTGDDNSFFGRSAGRASVSGNKNSFFGKDAGRLTDIGSGNTFVGTEAGEMHTEGINNTFVGMAAGNTNTTGGANTVIGYNADVGSSGLVFATAIGALAVVNNSSSVVLGRSADTVRIPGDLIVTGTVSKGGGSFKIDHPLDPANKTLSHSFVESPDTMNIYNGVVRLNRRGRAVVTLPTYFEALNRDFRYQLTAIGKPAPNLFVWRQVAGNTFEIAGGKPGMEVSWQVTGVRQDAYANAHRIPTEELKPEGERGTYLHPDLFTPKPTATTATAIGARTAPAKRVQ